ncbi:uncharacterized protein RBU33_024798 isoform 3-T3 [Hipposideros larvatus]
MSEAWCSQRGVRTCASHPHDSAVRRHRGFCFTLRQKPEQITFQHVCDHNIVLFNWFLSSRVRVWPSLLTSPTISLLSAPFSVDSTWLSCTPPTSSLFSSTSTPGHT